MTKLVEKRTVDMQIIGEWVTPGSRVLDLGCGRGALLDYLHSNTDRHGKNALIDAKGKIVHDFLDDRMIGMDLKDMARVPVRICVAGGPRKVAAIRAALAGKHATMLVTDSVTAKALLDEPA